MNKPLIVNCANGMRGGAFFEPHLRQYTDWIFVDASETWWVERLYRRPNTARLRAGYRAARRATRAAAQLLVSHDPRVTFSCERFLRRPAFAGRHLAFSFNLPALPGPRYRKQMAERFKNVDRFVVFSSMERQLYHEAFDIPLEKFDFIHWAVNPPLVEPADRPVVGGDYACALGGNSRDYATLMEAMRKLPNIRLVLVARPHNLVNLSIPPNVDARVNISGGEAMNILKFSRFMVLPLAHSAVPCGHVTLVAAMHLAKAFVISNSAGVADYVRHEENALTCQAKSADALAAAMCRLQDDAPLRDRLSANGLAFARQYCTERRTFEYFCNYLGSIGLLEEADRSRLIGEAGAEALAGNSR